MKVMVTGADGYIGKGVVERLLKNGNDVLAMGLSSCGASSDSLTEIVGDIFNYDFSCEVAPDVLLHLAWRNGFMHNDMAHLDDLPKHYRFIKSAVDSGIKRIAVMGSMHEVGYYEGVVDENTPCNPTTPYGVAKNALRQLTAELCRQSETKMQWLRGFYLVSSDGRGSSILAKLVQASREGKEDFPFTSGKCKYDFLPYDEFCDQVFAVISQEEINGIINICSGEPIALGSYIERFIIDNNLRVKLNYGKYPDRPYDSPAIWGDNSKIKAILSTGDADV